jgi:hypothetical protein
MALDAHDIRLGEVDPQNRPLCRARRVIDAKISALESELANWKFVRDVLEHELKEQHHNNR